MDRRAVGKRAVELLRVTVLAAGLEVRRRIVGVVVDGDEASTRLEVARDGLAHGQQFVVALRVVQQVGREHEVVALPLVDGPRIGRVVLHVERFLRLLRSRQVDHALRQVDAGDRAGTEASKQARVVALAAGEIERAQAGDLAREP